MAKLYVEWLDRPPRDGDHVTINGLWVGVYQSHPGYVEGFVLNTGEGLVTPESFANLLLAAAIAPPGRS